MTEVVKEQINICSRCNFLRFISKSMEVVLNSDFFRRDICPKTKLPQRLRKAIPYKISPGNLGPFFFFFFFFCIWNSKIFLVTFPNHAVKILNEKC